MHIIEIDGKQLQADGSDIFCSDSGIMQNPGDLLKKSIDVNGRTVWAVFSSDAKDLEGDVVKQNGWDLKRFNANPVSLYMHNPFNPPIANVPKIRKNMKAREGMDGQRMSMAQFKFPSPGGYELSDITWFLIQEEILRAVSAGFIATEMKDIIKNDGNGREFFDGREISKQMLLEISWGAIPMNQDSLTAAGEKAVAKGLDGGRVKALIEGDPEAPADGKLYVPGIELTKAVEDEGEEISTAAGQKKAIDEFLEKKIWEEKENEIRYRVKDPADFQENSFRTITLKKDKPRVNAVIGKLKGETSTTIQALRFPKEDDWTMAKAKAWVKDHPDAVKALVIVVEQPVNIEHSEEPKSLNHYAELLFKGNISGQVGNIGDDSNNHDNTDEPEKIKSALVAIRDEHKGEE